MKYTYNNIVAYDTATNCISPEITGYKLANYPKQVESLRLCFGSLCNFQCAYCCQWDENYSFNYDNIESVIHTAVEKLNLQSILLWGGEAAAHPAFPIVLDVLKQYPQIAIATGTNGTAIEKYGDRLIEQNVRVQLSHDGPGQHLRGMNILDTHLTIVRELCAQNVMYIASVLTRENPLLSELYEYFHDKFQAWYRLRIARFMLAQSSQPDKLPKEYRPRGSSTSATSCARLDSDITFAYCKGHHPTASAMPMLWQRKYGEWSFMTQ
jgi:organic radical activating enzyme